MNCDAWRSLKKNLFFTSEDVAGQFGITRAAAHVLCSRQVKNGAFIFMRFGTRRINSTRWSLN